MPPDAIPFVLAIVAMFVTFSAALAIASWHTRRAVQQQAPQRTSPKKPNVAMVPHHELVG